MLLRGLLAVIVVSAVALLSARNVLDMVSLDHLLNPEGDGSTLSMAPFSLGNPAAAATLRIRHPANPRNDEVQTPSLSPYVTVVQPGPGDVLANVITAAGVPGTQAQAAVHAMTEVYSARKIRAGQDISLQFLPDGSGGNQDIFLGFSFHPGHDEVVRVWREEDGTFRSAREERELLTSYAVGAASIDSSLYEAGVGAGVPAAVLVEMIRIFSWDVDFQRDIQQGDAFEVMYEKISDAEGNPVRSGRVQFAALTLRGERKEMYLFSDDEGREEYFNPKGQSVRRALLRTPINGARLSSGFGNRRHPILGYNKMHRGVDFAAPTGTPIYAAGDGQVEVAGWNGGYGKYVRIRHGNRYSTAYAHLNGIAKGVSKGSRVRQGQVIGYVGTTGRSTGPHLHYEILVENKQVNPMNVKMPTGRSLAGKELARFQRVMAGIEGRYAGLIRSAPDQVATAADRER